MYSIVEVCPPGGEWLRVVDDPEVGSVWEVRGGGVFIVIEPELLYREYYLDKTHSDNQHKADPAYVVSGLWQPVDSSRIVEGMDGGRRRRFVKTGEKRHARPGDYVWAPLNQAVRLVVAGKDGTPEAGTLHACAGGNTHTHGEFEILLPLNFIDPAPSITPATVKESLQVDHQSKKYIDDLLHRLGSVGEPGAYRDMVREAKAVIESLTMKVDPLSWDANPPMVGDFVQDKDGHRMMITTQYSDGKVVVGEYDSDPIELSRDELKQKGYVRLILSPLHKEATP